MSAPEFSRTYRADTLGEAPRRVEIAAEEGERAALAARFRLPAIDSLDAEAAISRHGDVIRAEGRVRAAVTQSCVATGEPVSAAVDEAFRIEFRPQPETARADEEIELSEGEMDVVFYDGAMIDLGEAVAETLALGLDPFPRSPDAEAALREAGVKSEGEAGPFGALAALRDKMRGQ
ncbi:MAG: YceD family protein [Allosphingosinicella sp.]|uniref:YceD family protein n=1 Tax=Allosphingosinicella sp. TaxID=2823234 RepID=UPI0039522982